MPRSAACTDGSARSASQNGSTPTIRRKEGRNTATRASAAPGTPLGGAFMVAPR
jgi:hypothetical protein